MFLSGKNTLSSKTGEDLSELPVGVALHDLTKLYGLQVAIENLNVSFHEGHVTSLLGPNGAGKTTTMYVYLFLIFTRSACATNAFSFAECVFFFFKYLVSGSL